MQRVIADYERQTSFVAAKSDMVGDALDSMFEVDGEGEASSEAVSLVLEEAGLDAAARLRGPPAPGRETSDDGFAARLQALRGP